MMIKKYIIIFAVVSYMLTGCMKWEDPRLEPDFSVLGDGVYIVNEGNFQYGNASLSYYDPISQKVENEVFYRVNGMKLGDVAQSMTVYDGLGWVVVNNSHVVFAIDPKTFREKGRIEGLTSPRYIHFINKEKAYITQLWDNRIAVINPQKYAVIGYIEIADMKQSTASTEQMVQSGDYVYCVCWSHQRKVLKIDTKKDAVVSSIEVGAQPQSLVVDADNNLWVLTDGGYKGSPSGYENPKLSKINLETFTVTDTFEFPITDSPSELCISKDKQELYWLNRDVWKMNIHDNELPAEPIIYNHNTIFYGLAIDNGRNEIYVADAIDYQQQGMIYRYSASSELIDSFYVGIIPGFILIPNNNE